MVQDGTAFSGRLDEGVGTPSVHLVGTLSHPAPQTVLGPFFEQVHARLLENTSPVVEVDLRDVVYMNSASFKSLIEWICLIQSPGALRRYRLCFLVDRKRRWQPTSVHALRCFAPELVEMTSAN